MKLGRGKESRARMRIARQTTLDERSSSTTSIIAALSELAATVQRQRTVDAVLENAGRGVLRLGMRLVAFQLKGDAQQDLVLRHLATSPQRYAAIERRLGRSLAGLTARAADVDLVVSAVKGRRILFRPDLDVFATFLRKATGYDPSPLDMAPETAGVTTGVLAPLFVRDEPWGLLVVYSRALTRADTDAVALFATHVGSALEVAESLETLARTQEELVKRERLAALGELAAVVAHEVRNPLGVLFNSIGSLRTIIEGLREAEPDPEKQQKDAGAPASSLQDARTLLAIAAEESNRLNRIVSDLLEFARPYEMALLPSSIADLVNEATADTSDDHTRIRLEIDSDLPLVDLDPRYMRQALLNLLLNALQASPSDRDVIVRATSTSTSSQKHLQKQEPELRLDVIDRGVGIPMDARDSIFEPFFTTKASGTGLGLAIVKRIVDGHRGRLDFVSSELGTTFSITLPIESVERWPSRRGPLRSRRSSAILSSTSASCSSLPSSSPSSSSSSSWE